MTSLFTKISRLSDDKKARVQEALDLLDELSIVRDENKRLREAEKQRDNLIENIFIDTIDALEYTYEEQYQKATEIIQATRNRLKGIL